MKRQVLIVAGGKGLRMGAALPKQFLPIGGQPVLMHTIRRFYEYDADVRIILVLPREQQPYWKTLCAQHHFGIHYELADGGETRFHSVRNGLEKAAEVGAIAVHDGVRPFVSKEVIARCFQEAEATGAALPVIDLVDSLRLVDPSGAQSKVVDRSLYRLVQTPQVFRAALLKEAYRQPYHSGFTDDASVVEAAGHSVTLIPGNRENIKITNPLDLQLAELLCPHV